MLSSLNPQMGLNNTIEDKIETDNILYLYPDPIVVDGILSPGEWDNAINVTKWYMDADPENYDGYNYMYLTEDRDNVYIALDLVSDQTNDEAGEWVGLWLNTNKTINDGFIERDQIWHDSLNKGMESLIYDVDNDQVVPYFVPTAGYTELEYRWFSDLNDFYPIEGTFEGSIDNFNSGSDNNPAIMTAVWNGTDYVYRLDIEIPVADYYDLFTDLYTPESMAVGINSRISSNVTLNNHYYTIRNSVGDLLLNNPKQTQSINPGTSYSWVEGIDASRGNYTQDDKVLFSYIGVNDVPFHTNFDEFMLEFWRTPVSRLANGAIQYPYSSINNFDIAWSFGGSANNLTDHRIFEFKLPKTELEGYDQDTDLGLFFAGYGTLAAWPNTHHWLLANGTVSDPDFAYTPFYNNFEMPLKSWTFLDDPVLNVIDPNPSDNGSIILDWNDDAGVVNWTVIRHTSIIDDTNIKTVDIIATGLTTSTFVDTGLANGTYYYAVVAIDNVDYLYLSNIESVVVSIPEPIPDPTTTDPTTTDDPTTTPIITSTPDSTTISTSSTLELPSPGIIISLGFVTIVTMLIYNKRRK